MVKLTYDRYGRPYFATKKRAAMDKKLGYNYMADINSPGFLPQLSKTEREKMYKDLGVKPSPELCKSLAKVSKASRNAISRKRSRSKKASRNVVSRKRPRKAVSRKRSRKAVSRKRSRKAVSRKRSRKAISGGEKKCRVGKVRNPATGRCIKKKKNVL